MVKTVTERFDKDGKLVERVTVEETRDESIPAPCSPDYPWWSHGWISPTVKYCPYVTYTS